MGAEFEEGRPATDARHVEMLEALKLFRVIFATTKRQYEQVKKATGLAGAQAWALAEIGKSPGITAGELARKMTIHRSTAANLVARLEERKLLVSQRDGGDRRLAHLELTTSGKHIFSKAEIPKMGVLMQALMDSPEPTLRALRRHLQILVNVMQNKDRLAHLTPLVSQFKDEDSE